LHKQTQWRWQIHPAPPQSVLFAHSSKSELQARQV
jgi:hypothetical protein